MADSDPATYKILSTKTIWWAAAIIILVAVGTTVWLLLAFGYQLEAIKTASTIVLGTGGAAALLLAARRQRSTEIALNQKDRDLQHQERDAIERRITDLYTKAADQLGSEKAPVRLAGLYALERVAQDNPTQRQTIVNVLCAYLRMPYQPPGSPPAADADTQLVAAHREQVQEREVRLTAQRLLADHLRPGDDPDNASPTFWANINLDLTGATLIDFSLAHCAAHNASFRSATFTGVADFQVTTFSGDTDFGLARFSGYATFKGITFTGAALFQTASFAVDANFSAAHFVGPADFTMVSFGRDASFYEARFDAVANFGFLFFQERSGATFTRIADFSRTVFGGIVHFESVRFNGDAYFRGTTFHDSAEFGDGWKTEPATFDGKVNFEWTSFALGVPKAVSRYWSPPPDQAG